MKFSIGDLHAFASKIVLDIESAHDCELGHEVAQTVYESLLEILPNDERAPAEY